MSEIVASTTETSAMDREALVQAILDLEGGDAAEVANPELAHELALHLKPHVDRLATLKAGGTADPSDAEVELLEIGREVQTEDTEPAPKRPPREPLPEGPVPELLSLPPREQARWIFMERFISLEQHEEILGYAFDSEDFVEYERGLDRMVSNMLLLPRTVEVARMNDIPTLQEIFASSVLVFRNPFIGDDQRSPVPCTMESLRRRCPSYFYQRPDKPSWYESREFYAAPMGEPRWVLCQTEFLNCTLRRPERKLSGYAKSWNLPTEYVIQKTVLEDVYDRIVCGEALQEDVFAGSCNSCTATAYRGRGDSGPVKHVYTVQRGHKIGLHGKTGTPHWRAKRRLWPGVFPTVVFP